MGRLAQTDGLEGMKLRVFLRPQAGTSGTVPAEQKLELWNRWKAGESLSEIGRMLGKQPGSIHGVVASNGGYVLAPRCRSPRALSFAEREEISRGLADRASRFARSPADSNGRPQR